MSILFAILLFSFLIFIHEFGHLLKSSINYLNTDNSTHFTLRSGIHIFGGKVDDDGQLHEFSEHQTLDEVIKFSAEQKNTIPNTIVIDSTITRFKYVFECFWKFLKRYLE